MNGYMRFFDNFFGFFKNIGISFYDSVIMMIDISIY